MVSLKMHMSLFKQFRIKSAELQYLGTHKDETKGSR